MGIPMVVAGRQIDDAIGELRKYVVNNGRALREYDLAERSHQSLSRESVVATRRISSRVSEAQLDWFLECVNGLDWSNVPEGARIADADPRELGGLFDSTDSLYGKCLSSAPAGVNVGKISKVLHLMRPDLFPILDARIRRAYRTLAQREAASVRETRADFPYRRTYWGAIRNDVIANSDQLQALREAARVAQEPLLVAAGDNLSDVRLLDLVVWRLG